MRIFRPSDAPTWLVQVLSSIEGLFRQIMPAPFKLKDYATADLPAAADHAQGLVYDSDDATLKLSDGADWKAFAELDSGGKVLVSQLPGLALTDIYTVNSEAAMVALVAQEGDIAVRTDLAKTFAHNGGTAGTAADWTELLSPPFQPLDNDLTAIAALTTTAYGRALLELANAAALRTAAGLVIGTDVQAQDAELAALAGLTSAADKVPYFTGSGTAALADLSSVARTLLAQTTQALMRTAGLGLGTAAIQNTGSSGATVPLLNGNNTYSGGMLQTGTVLFRVENSGSSVPSGAAGIGFEFAQDGSNAILQSYNRTSSAFAPIDIKGSQIRLRPNDALPGNYANDAAAAAGGVPVGAIYRNGSVLMVRAA